MEYFFNNNIVFTPNAEIKLMVNGEAKKLSKQSVDLLQYFLDANEKIRNYDQILAAVWGPGEYIPKLLGNAKFRASERFQFKAHWCRNGVPFQISATQK